MNGQITFKHLNDLAEFLAFMEYQKIQSKFTVTKDQYSQSWVLTFEE